MRVFWIVIVLIGSISATCGEDGEKPTLTSVPKPSSASLPIPPRRAKATPVSRPTTIATKIECSDIVRALEEGGSVWSDFYQSSLGATIQFTGYIFEIDTGMNLISVYSDGCQLEIWLKGIPHADLIYLSYTQMVTGTGTIEGYPDLFYMDEVLVNVDLGELVIQ